MKAKNAIVGTKVTVKKSYGISEKTGLIGTIVDFLQHNNSFALVKYNDSTITHGHDGFGVNVGDKKYPNSWYIGVKFLKLAEH